MFQTICDLIPADPDMPERARRLDILRRALNGTLYDALPHDFHEERSPSGEYIPLRLRRPSVRYALPRIVTEDSVALLFCEGHFPTIDSPDRSTRDTLAALFKAARLNEVMIDAAIRGSIGSVAILMRILAGRPFFTVIDTVNLTPTWRPDAPDTLATVTERYKLPGANFAAAGYPVPDIGATYWFTRSWDDTAETWYPPPARLRPVPAHPRPARSVNHGLGFVPIAWVRNLPGASWTGDDADGACTFRAAIETGIEIDYQLSQAGRGLKYSSDPTLLIKEPAGLEGDLVRGAGNALIVSEHGDAKLLEIGGTASSAVIEYVRTLREFALESVHGNRADASRLAAATSGRALELMNQGLLWLADNLRISYGEGALLDPRPHGPRGRPEIPAPPGRRATPQARPGGPPLPHLAKLVPRNLGGPPARRRHPHVPRRRRPAQPRNRPQDPRPHLRHRGRPRRARPHRHPAFTPALRRGGAVAVLKPMLHAR